jgi:CRP-like cAMP-binding protein
MATLNRSRTIGCFGHAASGLLLPHLSEVELTAGQSLGVAGARPQLTYFPVDCLLSIVSTESIEALSVGRDGSSFPQLALKAETIPLDVVVSIGGRAWSIKTAKLQALAANEGAIEAGLFEACQETLRQAALVSIARAKASRMGNLARWLYRACEVTGKASLAISHAYLATLLGTRRQTITTSLAEMERMNLIATQRTLIAIRDPAGLARFKDKPA